MGLEKGRYVGVDIVLKDVAEHSDAIVDLLLEQ